ncbi:hypothetical protein KBX71_18595 [Micromonospora sp. D93]|uniref:hypothetical protein n=1 Tax=Micromonospora sp. D93 TaxID=2824886 RepID=UPI001B377890|nr:hypothetical protein [Micromonospora sp. D93]MBQ1019858.1 hypothetical protein [Micromonospora sp. D93]
MVPTYAWLAVMLAQAEFGDVATWIGAVANVATVVLALVASLVGFRIYKIESGRDQRAEDERRERAEDQRRSQAQLISVWFAEATKKEHTNWGKSGTREVKVWAAHVLNASNQPIYDVLVIFSPRYADTLKYLHPLLQRGIREWILVVPPHQDVLTVAVPDLLAETGLGTAGEAGLVVSLEFRDASGRRWLRDREGYLLPLPPRRL